MHRMHMEIKYITTLQFKFDDEISGVSVIHKHLMIVMINKI